MKSRCFPAILCCLGALLFLAASQPAYAQITRTARIELTDSRPVVYFGDNVYITQDPEERLSADVIGMRHENNLRGARQDSEIINLGLASIPSWLVFSVTNNSSTEDWVLNFGSLLGGRMGLAHKLLITNQTTHQIYADAMREQSTPGHGYGEDIEGSSIPVKIGIGKTELFVAYAEMEDGFPAMLAPSLMTAKSYRGSLGFDFLAAAMEIFLVAAIAAFLTFALLFRDPAYALMASYFGLCLLIFFLVDHLFFARFSFTGEGISVLASMAVLWSLATARLFLNITVEEHMENSALFAMACVVTLCTLTSFLVQHRGSSLDEALIFIPHLIAICVITGLAFLQGQQGKPGGLYYAAGWGCFLPGFLITALTTAGFFSASAFNMDAGWFALIPQAAFFMAAALKKVEMTQAQERHFIAKESRATQSLARLKQSKESADQARLLRVIERERELMAELREREIQRTDEMRKAKDMADHANLAKSAFLAVVSHEIRTPMNGIMGILRLMKDTKMNKEQSDYILAIQKSGDTMMALLNDILDFEKIETGNMELERIDFDLPRLVQGVVTLMSGHAATKNIFLKCEIAEDFPRYVEGDPTRLRQILLNLVNNAIKFTHKGGVTIRLRSAKLEGKRVAQAGKGDYEVIFAVEDTGIGISDEAQEKLFTPFQQGGASIARKYGGTGLGLAICQRLVAAMGGAIRVASMPSTGSTFSFSVLMEKAKTDPAEDVEMIAGRPARSAAPPMTLLVIEDNEINRKVMRSILEKDGHKVIDSDHGEDAADLCQKNTFDAVFLDINLSGASGLDIARTIRNLPDRRKAAVPIIAITGNVADKDIADIRKSGFNDYLPKPVDFDKLLRMLGDIHAEKYANEIVPQKPVAPAPVKKPAAKAVKNEEDKAPIHAFLQTLKEDNTVPDDDFDSFSDVPEQPGFTSGTGPLVFDEKMVKGLLVSLGRGQVADLMKGFMEKADEIIAAMEALAKRPDAGEIHDRAHELKGMASNFGINELSEIAKLIERAAKDSDLPIALAEIKKLAPANKRAKAAIRQWLG